MTYTEMNEKYPHHISIYDHLLENAGAADIPLPLPDDTDEQWGADDILMVMDDSPADNPLLIFKCGDNYVPMSLMDFRDEVNRTIASDPRFVSQSQ